MSRARAIPLAAVTTAAAAVAVLLACGAFGSSGPTRSAAQSFLQRYVAADGRVARLDQGGDTVSEGQAYAMLVAAAEGEAATFARIWGWTRANLLQPDGLLAWHWQGGRVVDPSSAADGDLDAAWALLLAAQRFGNGGYRTAGLALGRAILARETVTIGGRAVLVAGDWARSVPARVDPSYFAPAAFAALGRASGDPRWGQLEASSRQILSQLTNRRTGLAPDWAVVGAGGTAWPTPPPGGSGEAVFGFDAVRVPLWQAAGCEAGDRELAARSAPFLAKAAAGSPSAEYSLGGEPRGAAAGAPFFVAAAAASRAAGRPADAGALLVRAEAAEQAESTYYGAALLALGRESLGPKGPLACQP
ncbi:MAG: glycoside hydrolase [Actinobacteria bacterium]|nr:glycoside hydrolase [Actinomycetota bacterium]